MNRFFKSLPVFVVVMCVFVSCQKKDNIPADLTKVIVTFTEPADGAVFHKGDTVQVNTNIDYVSEILGVYIQVIDTTTGNKLFEDNRDLHTDHFTFPTAWADTLSEPANLQIKVSVFVSGSTTPAERSIYIRSMP